MRYITFCLAMVLLASSSGCAGFSDLGIMARDRSAAYKAWKGARWSYFQQGVGCKMREHIGRGFQEGYYDVAQGGDGQVPLFPPGYYWGAEYQNPTGNEYVAAWFRGYSDGALAAEQAGIAGYHSLPTSWAPPYAGDPDSPDGGYSPYLPPSSLEGGTAPSEGIPPGRLDGSPQLPTPPRPMPAAPIPLPKSVNAPLNLGVQSEASAELPPTDATQPQPPTLTAPNGEIKANTPPTTPPAASPGGKQTFLPPGSPKAPLTSEVQRIPHVTDSPGTAIKK